EAEVLDILVTVEARGVTYELVTAGGGAQAEPQYVLERTVVQEDVVCALPDVESFIRAQGRVVIECVFPAVNYREAVAWGAVQVTQVVRYQVVTAEEPHADAAPAVCDRISVARVDAGEGAVPCQVVVVAEGKVDTGSGRVVGGIVVFHRVTGA